MWKNNIAKCLVHSPCSVLLERIPRLIGTEYFTAESCHATIGHACLNKFHNGASNKCIELILNYLVQLNGIKILI